MENGIIKLALMASEMINLFHYNSLAPFQLLKMEFQYTKQRQNQTSVRL